jgi:hypothetical protein
LHGFNIRDNKGNKIVDGASTMQILNTHEVEGEGKIHIYIVIDPNVAPLQIKNT